MNKQTKTTHNYHTTKTHQNRIKNWTNYNQGLVARGDFTILISQAIVTPIEQTGKPGHPKEYSDALILVLAAIREFTGLPFRQLIGHAAMLVSLFGCRLPSYTTLCKRMQKLQVPSSIKQTRLAPGGVCLLVDSTGLKVAGEGEWKVRKHGASHRRSWVKLHLGVDFASEQILCFEATADHVADGVMMPNLLNQALQTTSVSQILGDGAYASHSLYQAIEERGVNLLSPPHKNARLHVKFAKTHSGRGGSGGKYADFIDEPGWSTYNRYVRSMIHLGVEEWKKQTGYHKRSLAETTMWRLKSAFSDRLKSRCQPNQEAEIALRVYLLNTWTNQAMPTYT